MDNYTRYAAVCWDGEQPHFLSPRKGRANNLLAIEDALSWAEELDAENLQHIRAELERCGFYNGPPGEIEICKVPGRG